MVVEVGILNYALSGDDLLVKVMIKVIDPNTGKTLGRVDNHRISNVGSFDNLIDLDGELFKRTYIPIAQDLLEESLSDLGLLKGRRAPMFTSNLSQKTINALVACESKYPNASGIFDPLTGYFLFEGVDAENNQKCLIEKHGWYKVGPPRFTEGTMAPPW